MGLLDNIRKLFTSPTAPPSLHMRAIPGGRASMDSPDAFAGASWLLRPPTDFDTNWQLMQLEARTLDRLSPATIMDMMTDLSPEVSRALWDFLRLCNPGWEFEALRPGSEVQDKRAMDAIWAFMAELDDLHGSSDVMFGRLFMGPFVRGAFCAELVLDKRGRMPIDIATPDPGGIRFRQRSDPERGQVWQPGQWQGTEFVPLDRPTFRYIPVDPAPGVPYGRALANPALFTAVFLIGTLHDLKRVIQQQGYPRLDLVIDTQRLAETAPQLVADATAFNAYVSDVVSMVATAYSALKPDDAYIHTDQVTVNSSVGAVTQSSLAGIDGIIKALERMCVRALKTMPLMLALGEGSTEGEANRQWEIYAAGIKSIQHYAEALMERLLTLALEAQGIQSDITFRFAELRAAELLRDAQTEAMQIANAKAKYEQGWYSQDEASEEVTGHAADAPEPRTAAGGNADIVQDNGDGQEQLNGQANRAAVLDELRAARADVAAAMQRVSVNGYH